MYQITRFELAVLDWIAEHLTRPYLDPIMKAITFLSDGGWFWIALAIIFLCFKKTRRYGIAMAISLILSTLLTNVILKPLVNRIRPYNVDWHPVEGIDTSLLPNDASFPSGHTTFSFSAALSLFWQNKKLGAPALALATLIAFSRLYFYLHFPTDIAGGMLVGFIASVASSHLTPLAIKGIASLAHRIKASHQAK